MYMYVMFNEMLQAIRQRAKKQRIAKKTSSALGSAVSSGAAAVVIENIAQTQRLGDGSFRTEDDKPTNTASGSNEDEDDEK
jgi:hypothetical protein